MFSAAEAALGSRGKAQTNEPRGTASAQKGRATPTHWDEVHPSCPFGQKVSFSLVFNYQTGCLLDIFWVPNVVPSFFNPNNLTNLTRTKAKPKRSMATPTHRWSKSTGRCSMDGNNVVSSMEANSGERGFTVFRSMSLDDMSGCHVEKQQPLWCRK